MRLSKRQSELYRLGDHDHKMVLSDGPIRSGKTLAGLWGFLTYTQQTFDRFADGAVVAVQSRPVWRGPVATEVHAWAARVRARVEFKEDYFTVSTLESGRRHTNRFNRITANNAAAVSRIQGMTICGAYATEAALMEEEFVTELKFRSLTANKGKIVLDCNPEGRYHWLKTDYIDKAAERGMLHLPFKIEDNPTVTPKMWQDLVASTPPGHVARRKLYGEWCDPTGLVWDLEGPRSVGGYPRDEDPKGLYVGIDSAASSVTHAVLVGKFAKAYWVIDEWRRDFTVAEQMSPAAQVRSIADHFAKWGRVDHWVCDAADGHFAAAMRESQRDSGLTGRLHASDKRVKEGIDAVAWWLHKRQLRVDRSCIATLRDMGNYSWDDRAAARGEDRPVKENDHGCDAVRYCIAMILAIGQRNRQRVMVHSAGRR